jgi:hypothetical protein
LFLCRWYHLLKSTLIHCSHWMRISISCWWSGFRGSDSFDWRNVGVQHEYNTWWLTTREFYHLLERVLWTCPTYERLLCRRVHISSIYISLGVVSRCLGIFYCALSQLKKPMMIISRARAMQLRNLGLVLLQNTCDHIWYLSWLWWWIASYFGNIPWSRAWGDLPRVWLMCLHSTIWEHPLRRGLQDSWKWDT